VDPVTAAAAVIGLGGLMLVASLYPDLFDSIVKVLFWGLLVALVAAIVYEFEHRHIIERLIARPGQQTAEAIGADIQQDALSIDWLQWPLAAFVVYLAVLLAIGRIGRRKVPRKGTRQVVPQRR
jgi:hypothetical protein